MSKTFKELLDYAYKISENRDSSDVFISDCKIIEFLFDNCEIEITENNHFFVNTNTTKIGTFIRSERAKKFTQEIESSEFSDGQKSLAYTGLYDFGHTTAEWETVIELGIYGLRKRIDDYISKTTDDKKLSFYSGLAKVYDGSIRFMNRAAEKALSLGKTKMAEGLQNLTKRPPQNLFEALQTSAVYYVLQQCFDGTILRTLGRLDKLFYPFYIKEDKAYARELFTKYMYEFNSRMAVANTPFALGGTDAEGNSLINELSYEILDIYTKSHLPHMKFHMLCADNTPRNIIEAAFRAIREGNNSIVFMSDNKVIESLEKIGAEHKDASNYHIVGCYECGSDGEVTCSCNARVNLPKALEVTLNGGFDMLTGKKIGLDCPSDYTSFEELFDEFEKQVRYFSRCAMKITDIYEKNYNHMHSSPIMSATYTHAMETGKDVYCDYGAKYNNSSVNAVGLATATDSLSAIRKLVFEDGILSLAKLRELLISDWKDSEALRLTIKNKFPKFGTGDTKTDNIAKDITNILADEISGKPNAKGGVYRLGLFSIDWRWEFGEKTAASADGRLSGESLSQNTSASFGADKNGATAHLLSVTAIDASNTPNGAIVDIDLHSSAVKGENGLNTLVSTLKTYFDMGGFAVHYNVLDTETLKAAKLHPENYPTLQVRLCGWNVLFSSLSEKEKDEFIARSVR